MRSVDHAAELANPKNRRTRTVMFVDMNDSTAMKESTTEVNWRGACAYLFDLVFDELASLTSEIDVESRNGVEKVEFPRVKYLGDGVMAVFAGVPPEKILNAAIRMQNRIDYLNRQKTVEFTCSISISHGGVVEWESAFGLDYIGTLVDKAARLCEEAPAGAIWIDDQTADAGDMTKPSACSSEFEITPLGTCIGPKRTVSLRSFKRPVPYHEVRSKLGGRDEAVEVKPVGPKPDIGAGTVRRWDPDTGHGFIVDTDGNFYYSDRRFVASANDLERGDRVFFLVRDPLVPGKNRVAACGVVLGKRYTGRVHRVTDKGYGFVNLTDTMGNLWSMFLYLGDNPASIQAGDEVTFEIGENPQGACGVAPERLA